MWSFHSHQGPGLPYGMVSGPAISGLRITQGDLCAREPPCDCTRMGVKEGGANNNSTDLQKTISTC